SADPIPRCGSAWAILLTMMAAGRFPGVWPSFNASPVIKLTLGVGLSASCCSPSPLVLGTSAPEDDASPSPCCAQPKRENAITKSITPASSRFVIVIPLHSRLLIIVPQNQPKLPPRYS